MAKIDMTKLRVFCTKDTCGDPVPGLDGIDRRSKRQMEYCGQALSVFGAFAPVHVYRCPVCGTKKKFRQNFLTNGYEEI